MSNVRMTRDQVTREVNQIAHTGGSANMAQVMCLCALAVVWAIADGCTNIADAIDSKRPS